MLESIKSNTISKNNDAISYDISKISAINQKLAQQWISFEKKDCNSIENRFNKEHPVGIQAALEQLDKQSNSITVEKVISLCEQAFDDLMKAKIVVQNSHLVEKYEVNRANKTVCFWFKNNVESLFGELVTVPLTEEQLNNSETDVCFQCNNKYEINKKSEFIYRIKIPATQSVSNTDEVPKETATKKPVNT